MKRVILLSLGSALICVACSISVLATQTSKPAASPRPQGPCDIYAGANTPCVAAHSTTRALYASYKGPLYQVLRQSDGKTLNIGVVPGGGYADAAAQDAFCANTYCWITKIFDQSAKHNDLTQAPRGGFAGPAMGGFNNLPLADMAPITIMGHKVYGVFIAPGMGLRIDDPRGTAVDDQDEGQYWVINGQHYNSGCCFDYGNAEIDSRDDDNGTMETTYYGNAGAWYHGPAPGPWVMTDQENNLVGCVTTDGTKNCPTLPSITWRFVTAMAKGEPHHWTSMGGDAQRGPLQVMFDGPRVDVSYDPMRKQGAILLGNGGDNSVGSQGTFYEGAMTAAGTFPSDATDQLVQANVVAAKYDVARVSLGAKPTGVQTFSPGSSHDVTVTFTNTTGAAVGDVMLNMVVPKQWTAAPKPSEQRPNSIAPGESVSTTFTITSGPVPFNGDIAGRAEWIDQTSRQKHSETSVEKVRNIPPVKINEFRVTNPFIELYNAGTKEVDISNWSLTEHATQMPAFSEVKIPTGTKIAAGGFYLLGLSNSGLVAPAHKGDTTISVRSTTGMNVGDTVTIDNETRKIVSIGTAATPSTTLWQPLPDGPVITIPAGSTSVPVTNATGFVVGEKIAIGYGATYPAVARGMEKYEVATVTAVGKQGTQAFLGADALPGATNIRVTSVANISVGDKIRLDIASVGHGIETVTVTRVGTQSYRTALAANADSSTTSIRVRTANGFTIGDKMTVGTPANHEVVTITAISPASNTGTTVDFTPALAKPHVNREFVVAQGTGLELATPIKFKHAANLPFSAPGTGITFRPATSFAHSSNEPVQALGTGIALDAPLARDHDVDAVVRDGAVTTVGYPGTPAPNQWFGGPALSNAGAMVLRDAAGLVVDSLNYGLLVDPWASKGYQAESGAGRAGCRVASPGGFGFGPNGPAVPQPNRSAGRFPDGFDSDSDCTDFVVPPLTMLPTGAAAGATNLKVSSVTDFSAGQTIAIDADANFETAVIASVGTAGATTVGTATAVGATAIPVGAAIGFSNGQTITIDSGANQETAVIATMGGGRGGFMITVAAPLKFAHASGAPVSGSGITLTTALTKTHASGASITTDIPTPGAPNKYSRKRN